MNATDRFPSTVLQFLAVLGTSAAVLALPPAVLVAVYLASGRLSLALVDHGSALASYTGYALATTALVVLPGILTTALRRWLVRDVLRVSRFIGWVLFGSTLLVTIVVGLFPIPPWRSPVAMQTFVFVTGFFAVNAAALVATSVSASNRSPAERLRLSAALSTVPVLSTALLVAVDPNIPWFR